MIPAEKSYVYGTAARKIEYDVYEKNKVLKDKKEQRSNNKAKLKLVFASLLAFALLFFLMYRYAAITELNYNYNKTVNMYNEIKDQNIRLKAEIEEQTDLNKIKSIAKNRLGMKKPDKIQIECVNVPKIDYTQVSKEYKDKQLALKKNKSMFAVLLDKVGDMTEFIY